MSTDDIAPFPSVALSPSRILAALIIAFVFFMVAHVVVLWAYKTLWTTNQMLFFSTLFNLNEEANPPTWYASVTLLFCAGLLGIIAVSKASLRDHFTMHWRVLSLVFLYLSLDEAGRLHERAIMPLRGAFGLSGLLYHSWVLLAIPLVIVLGVSYLRFLLRLPAGTRRLFLLAGALYVGGAVGVEMVEGYYDELQGGVGDGSFLFSLFVLVEEGCEMAGVIIFIHALMLYIRRHVGGLQIRFSDSEPPAVEPPFGPAAAARQHAEAGGDVVPNGRPGRTPVSAPPNSRRTS